MNFEGNLSKKKASNDSLGIVLDQTAREADTSFPNVSMSQELLPLRPAPNRIDESGYEHETDDEGERSAHEQVFDADAG